MFKLIILFKKLKFSNFQIFDLINFIKKKIVISIALKIISVKLQKKLIVNIIQCK
jgi:hypothetical protein